MLKVTIVVLNWNRWNDTDKCLKSLQQLKISPKYQAEVVVVDNASTDSSSKLISKNYPELPLIVNQENFGYAGGNNVGIKYGLEKNSDYILLLNNDTIVHNTLITELINTSIEKKAQVVGPKIYFSKGYEFHKDRYSADELGKVIWFAGGIIDWNNIYGSHRGVDEVDTGQYQEVCTTDYVSGAAIFVSRQVFDMIGMLDEKYFMYYEDLDFCVRAKKAGFSLKYAPKAILWHNNAGSTRSGSGLQDYYITRNRLMFGLKYAPLRSKLALIKESTKLLINGRTMQKQAIRDYLTNHLGKRI